MHLLDANVSAVDFVSSRARRRGHFNLSDVGSTMFIGVAHGRVCAHYVRSGRKYRPGRVNLVRERGSPVGKSKTWQKGPCTRYEVVKLHCECLETG